MMRSMAGQVLVRVMKGFVEQVANMDVGGGVVDERAFAASVNQAGQAEFGQVLADGCWGGADEVGQASHRGFTL